MRCDTFPALLVKKAPKCLRELMYFFCFVFFFTCRPSRSFTPLVGVAQRQAACFACTAGNVPTFERQRLRVDAENTRREALKEERYAVVTAQQVEPGSLPSVLEVCLSRQDEINNLFFLPC